MRIRMDLGALPMVLAGCGGELTQPEPLLTGLPRPLAAAETRVVDAGNRFSFDLFRQVTAALPADRNVFLSPLSASMALGMVLNGAGTETFESMQSALRLGAATLAEINRGYRDLMQLVVGLDRTTEIVVANAVWSRVGFSILPAFLEAARTWFDAEVGSLDFASAGAVEAINRWVGDKTRNRVPRLLDELQSDEVVFLVNAIYFKGRWRVAFDRSRTRPAPFHAADGTVRDVPTMSLAPRELRYASTEAYEAVDLLYGNGAFAMTVILPRPGRTPADVLRGLDAERWRELTSRFGETKLGLSLPKFRLDHDRSLRPDLEALGMAIAFDPQRADFYGIADVRPERLFLTRVFQKAFVEVTEEGTEAAAATGVGVGITSAPPVVVVNRPFVFAIRERFSDAVLFLGQVNRLD